MRRGRALAVFLRGLNVGGHRRFRPATLAARLRHLEVVNIGAAGTLVVRGATTPAALQRDLERLLPFDARMAICPGDAITRMVARDPCARLRAGAGLVRFVSVLCGRARATPRLPLVLPPRGAWLLRVLGREGRFVHGLYRRHMKVIGHLGSLDRLFGVPVVTRQWKTMQAIAGVLGRDER